MKGPGPARIEEKGCFGMARSLVWVEGDAEGGWRCSNCRWKFPVPTLLSEKEARDAYDRLAAVKFAEHECEAVAAHSPVAAKQGTHNTLEDRARGLVMRGYKPKVAVELVLHELEFEYRNSPTALEKARVDAEAFLAKIRKGLI